ncbi:MAG: fluoride efflux transporter CrcB [Oligoflexia bacterium]|nr:fluoride efflux transporter CrcB [Oligoflexia bacterium]
MEKIILISIGGAIGALSRYGITVLSVGMFGDKFPIGTLFVNLLGCFLVGISFALGSEKGIISPHMRFFIVTGFLGALTTFSAFGIDSINLSMNGMTDKALINIFLNNVGGLFMVFLGLFLGRII